MKTKITRGLSLPFHLSVVADGLFDLPLKFLLLHAVLLLSSFFPFILIDPPMLEALPGDKAFFLELALHPSLPTHFFCLAALALNFVLLDATCMYIDEFLVEVAFLYALLISCP